MITAALKYEEGKADRDDILSHLKRCDDNFEPRLSDRVNLLEYSNKIFEKATTFEAWTGDTLQGLIAAYTSGSGPETAYITNVSVAGDIAGQGIASLLMARCIEWAEQNDIREVTLEVYSKNAMALKLYRKFGFIVAEEGEPMVVMKRCLDGGENY